jgi:multidrug transporter EmrE-like cation transporter
MLLAAAHSASRLRAGEGTAIRYDDYLSEERSRVKVLLEHSVLLVFLCTLIGAAAQILLKIGANQLASSNPLKMLLNPWLFCGYALYGMSTMLLILALRKGQLSVLYPVIALTYVWVTILSMMIFRESMNVYKAVGLSIVVAGVAVLGRDSRS